MLGCFGFLLSLAAQGGLFYYGMNTLDAKQPGISLACGLAMMGVAIFWTFPTAEAVREAQSRGEFGSLNLGYGLTRFAAVTMLGGLMLTGFSIAQLAGCQG
jgi:hypothetical protein